MKSGEEWGEYCKSGKKPADIPANPNYVYAETGWAGMGDWLGTGNRRGGWGDWLGTGTIAAQLRQYRSFKDARAFVRLLGLKSNTEWRDYCKSGKKPADIPNTPQVVYAKDGWAGIGDWLGYTHQKLGLPRRLADARQRRTPALRLMPDQAPADPSL